MFRVAKVLRDSGTYEPVVLFDAMYEGVQEDIHKCCLGNIDFIKEIPITSNKVRPMWLRGIGILLRGARILRSLSSRLLSIKNYNLPKRIDSTTLFTRNSVFYKRVNSYFFKKSSAFLNKVMGYELVLMSSDTQVKPGKFYIEFIDEQSLKYSVVDPSDKKSILTSYITKNDFQKIAKDEEQVGELFKVLKTGPHSLSFPVMALLNIASTRNHARVKIRLAVVYAIKYSLRIFRKIYRYVQINIEKFKDYLAVKFKKSGILIKKNAYSFQFFLSKLMRSRLIITIKKKSSKLMNFFLTWMLKTKLITRLCLISYKHICKLFPGHLPAISRAAFAYLEKIPHLLSTQNIKLMIFPEHNLFYFTQLFVYKGREYNVPSIIVPFTIANTIEWSEAFYKEPSRSMDNIYNKVVACMFPNWVHTYKNRQLLLPIELILFHEMLGITPKNPWLLNSGDIDFLAVESDAMKEYYISAGIEATKLKAIGALYNDELFQQQQDAEKNRAELYESLGLLDKPMMLCALPPNQIIGREDLLEFKTYEELVRCIIREMCKYSENYNIVINLHPRIAKESVAFLNEYPAKVSTRDITQLVPLSSIYVASCSATIRMAISCGIPVLNYDLYQYNYDDYIGTPGVITVTDKTVFREQLQLLSINKPYFQQIKEAQESQHQQWGKLDGKVGETLLVEIDSLFVSNHESIPR